jgi:hypothetical protein
MVQHGAKLDSCPRSVSGMTFFRGNDGVNGCFGGRAFLVRVRPKTPLSPHTDPSAAETDSMHVDGDKKKVMTLFTMLDESRPDFSIVTPPERA